MISQSYYLRSGSFNYSRQYKKVKIGWNGSTPADSFRPNLQGSGNQLAARKKLWDACFTQQKKVGQYFQSDKIFVKPQVTHFYLLPPVLASLACIGLTTFLEGREHARTNESLLEKYNAAFIKSPHHYIRSSMSEKYLSKLATMVAKIIDTRLLISLLHQNLQIEYVEMYRAISASLIDPNAIYSIEQMLTLNLIYGDLFTWRIEENTKRRTIWQDLVAFNDPYLMAMSHLNDGQYLSRAGDWHLALTREIADKIQPGPSPNVIFQKMEGNFDEDNLEKFTGDTEIGKDEKLYICNSDINLLQDEPQEFLSLETDGIKDVMDQLDEDTKKLFTSVASSLTQAVKNQNPFDQLPYHQLLDGVQNDPWGKTPIEGIPSSSAEVEVSFGGHKMQGIILEQVQPLSFDFDSIDRIKKNAKPIIAQLKKILYISPVNQNHLTKGSSGANFNAANLPIFQVSETLFAKSKNHLHENKRGESIVVLAGDSSGSNSLDQIECLKILTAAWIGASKTKQNQIEFLAANYDSGKSNSGHSGSMVRWIYNARFNEARTYEHAISRADSIKANGGNSDVKSWVRIMNEVKSIALDKPRLRNAHIYLILISDCAFNKSFTNTPFSALVEVQEYLRHLKTKEFRGRIHITLVNLGNEVPQSMNKVVDSKLSLTAAEVKDPSTGAQRISSFVSKAIKQQRSKISSYA